MGQRVDSFTSTVAGVVFGAAIGDALGLSVEGLPIEERRKRYSRGIKQYANTVDGVAHCGLNTYCTIAVLEGLLRARTHENIDTAAQEVAEEIIALTQGVTAFEVKAHIPGSSLLAAGNPWRLSGEVCSANPESIVRAVAYALWWAGAPTKAGQWAAEHVVMTHRHPVWQAVSFLIAMATAYRMQRYSGHSLENALFGPYLGECSPVFAQTQKAWADATADRIPTRVLLAEISEWGESRCIASALVCCIHGEWNFMRAVRLAVTHCPDSAAVGAITGALVGAGCGIFGIPERFGKTLAHAQELAMLTGRVAQEVTRFKSQTVALAHEKASC